jgi:hypothetical protein
MADYDVALSDDDDAGSVPIARLGAAKGLRRKGDNVPNTDQFDLSDDEDGSGSPVRVGMGLQMKEETSVNVHLGSPGGGLASPSEPDENTVSFFNDGQPMSDVGSSMTGGPNMQYKRKPGPQAGRKPMNPSGLNTLQVQGPSPSKPGLGIAVNMGMGGVGPVRVQPSGMGVNSGPTPAGYNPGGNSPLARSNPANATSNGPVSPKDRMNPKSPHYKSPPSMPAPNQAIKQVQIQQTQSSGSAKQPLVPNQQLKQLQDRAITAEAKLHLLEIEKQEQQQKEDQKALEKKIREEAEAAAREEMRKEQEAERLAKAKEEEKKQMKEQMKEQLEEQIRAEYEEKEKKAQVEQQKQSPVQQQPVQPLRQPQEQQEQQDQQQQQQLQLQQEPQTQQQRPQTMATQQQFHAESEWEETYEPADGRLYYCHRRTQQTALTRWV